MRLSNSRGRAIFLAVLLSVFGLVFVDEIYGKRDKTFYMMIKGNVVVYIERQGCFRYSIADLRPKG